MTLSSRRAAKCRGLSEGIARRCRSQAARNYRISISGLAWDGQKMLMRLGDAAASPAPHRRIACVDPACKLKAGLYAPAINLQAPAENLSLKAVGEIHDIVGEFQRLLRGFRTILHRR